MQSTQHCNIHTKCQKSMCLKPTEQDRDAPELNDFDGAIAKDDGCSVSELCEMDIADDATENVTGSKTISDQPMILSPSEEPIRRLRASSWSAEKPRRFFRTFWRGLLKRALSAEKEKVCMNE